MITFSHSKRQQQPFFHVSTKLLTAFSLCLLLLFPAQADEYVSFYSGQGLNHNFMELPGKLLAADLDFDPSWLAAAAYKRSCPPHSWIERFNIRAYCEANAVKHWGLQHHFEGNLAYQLVSPPWRLSGFDLHISAAAGLSYAFGKPSYEDGSAENPDKRYRFQNFNAYEIIYRPHQKNWFAFLRIHHRSGVYGLVAPRNVGSNFMTAGLSFKLNP